MKRGFSMIELIFVIVILGILASVALPKLAATRDDATASGLKTDVGTITQAVPALYMSQKVTSIIQSVPSLSSTSWTQGTSTGIDTGNPNYYVRTSLEDVVGSGNPCIEIAITNELNATTNGVARTIVNSDLYNPNATPAPLYPVLIVRIASGTRAGACDTLFNMGIRDQQISLQGLSIVW